ncbi:MAG TPA: ELM1/GtrOC1 family putative glycosyltransferase, partial [Candidatus Margulisiibacteriota bacterium]|nr:ELM1/GtrOC1 family putative glycosyltransferase [Candidatus Margulisiibacteriota bacterium]
VTEGALNLIDKDYLVKEAAGLMRIAGIKTGPLYLGVLIGGNAKGFSLDREKIAMLLREAKAAAEELDVYILATTSRRTPKDIEMVLKEEFAGYPRCRLLVVANENNIPEAVGGILGLSSVVIISPESISMVSEAVSSGKQVLVFESRGLSKKHRSFLEYFAQKEYLRLLPCDLLKEAIKKAFGQSGRPSLNDGAAVREALNKIL